MRPFARLLSAAYLGHEPARPTASEALGAVLLDATGLEPAEVERGRVLVSVQDGSANAIERALTRIFAGRVHDVNGLGKARAADLPVDDRIVLLDDSHSLAAGWWMPYIGENSLGCVFTVIEGAVIDPEVDAWITRRVDVPAVDTWPLIADAIRLASGGQFIIRENDLKGATVDDLRASLGLRTGAQEAVDTLRRIVRGRRKRKQRDKDMSEIAQGTEVAPVGEPLGVAADRVVKRLSEMTGFGEAAVWGMRLADDVRLYKQGELSWSDLDKGALLVGPPGSGKTTFAQALAAECEVELVVTSYGDWHEGTGDAVAKTLKKLFDRWRLKASDGPILLFVDEIDTIGARGKNGHGEHWYRSIINAWLQFLDGAIARRGIIVVAATNNADAVDAALQRPGRLDRIIDLPYPGIDAMAGIIRHHLGSDAVIEDGELRAAARACRGRSPAQVEQLCREARSLCRRIYKRRVCAEDVSDVLAAMRLAASRGAESERLTTVHEAGHAVAAVALGVTVQYADVDGDAHVRTTRETVQTRQAVEDEIVLMMSGRAAETVILGEPSSAALWDLRSSTALAGQLHGQFGLGAGGLLHWPAGATLPPHVTEAVTATLDHCHARALRLITRHRANVERVAAALMRDRYLDGTEIAALMRHPLAELRVVRDEPDDEPDAVPYWVPSPARRGHRWGPRMAA